VKVACLPLDDRPVNYDYLLELGALAGFEIELPEREWLGNPWRPSRHAELVDWLDQASRTADALLVALDTLGYGGLIPSRTSTESSEAVLERLSILRKIKLRRPGVSILAYSVILRICRSDSSEEEKPYWGEYGSRMFRLSYLEHKTSLGEADESEAAEWARLRNSIPDTVYEDYLQGRRRNHAVNRAMLDWLEEGLFDYLLLPQDDTADYGWNIAEARLLQGQIRLHGLGECAITYPGADETASLLLASLACSQAGFVPRVWPRYSSQASAAVITAFEDRPIHELLKAHLRPLQGCLASSSDQADLQLFINAPAEVQGAADLQGLIANEMAGKPLPYPIRDPLYGQTRREMTSPRRNIEEFVCALQMLQAAGQPVALVDVAFFNGADLLLGKQLLQSPLTPGLLAYSGWNTAGNSLGTALAQAVLCLLARRGPATPAQESAQLAFLFRRCLDDICYQSVVRTQMIYEELPLLGMQPGMERLPEDALGDVVRRLRLRMEEAAHDLRGLFVRSGMLRDVRVSNIHLPWQRLFEIGFDVRVELP
jgi:hypothetical protein